MTDVSVTIGTKGDVTGLKQIESGYQNLLNKSQQAYRAMTAASPMQAAADKQLHDRKMDELSRKASEIDRKIMAAKIGMAEGVVGTDIGRENIRTLQTEAMRVNFARNVAMEEGREATQAMRGRARMFGPLAGAGRFVVGRGLRYGGMAAGAMGAYSLISNIMGELGGVEQRNLAYATALSATRGRQMMDYGDKKPFFEIQEILEDLGQTAYMTSKEMLPMLEVAKELGNFSKGAASGLVGVANIGKSLGVDTAIISELFTGGLRTGSFVRGGQYQDLAKMMMLNQNMMHRATESLQSMGQVLAGTTHGVQGVGAFGVFNLLETLNRSGDLAYRGAGGANAALRFEQAFRSGGNENLQYMQTLALNPAFQNQNIRLAAESRNITKFRTDWGTGRYDQLISDMMKELGAFATPEDLIKNMPSDASAYIRKMYGGDGGMKKMNIQRLFDVYSTTYGAGESSGKSFFMQAMMAKDMGISMSDIGVFQRAMEDEKFMARAKEGGLLPGEMGGAYRAWEKGGKEGYEKWFNERAKNQETMIDIAKGMRGAIDKIKEVATEYLQPAGEAIKTYLPAMAEAFIKNWGTPEQKQAMEVQKLKGMGVGFDPIKMKKLEEGDIFGDWTTGSKILDFLVPIGRMKFHEGMVDKPVAERERVAAFAESSAEAIAKFESEVAAARYGLAEVLVMKIVEAIGIGFKDVNVTYPPGITPVDVD